MDIRLDHLKARELRRHRVNVAEIKKRARHWRLTDCSEETLVLMRRALIAEMEELEEQLSEADRLFMGYVEAGRPLDTEQTREDIERLTGTWESLNTHLQEIDEALLESQMRARLAQRLGGKSRVNVLDGFVLVAILVAVGLTIVELLWPLPAQTVRRIVIIDTVICFFLIADFFLRLAMTDDKSWYLRRYWIDLAASIPFYEVLRFGRLVRIVRFARLLRLLRLGRALRVLYFNFRGLSKLTQTFQMNLLKRSMLIALALLVFGALSINVLERPFAGAPEAQAVSSPQSIGESIWWSFTTVVTGGFADLYNPNTATGRIVTVGLVLLGLTVTGIFTASLTSVLVEDESSRIEQNQHTLESRMGVIDQKLNLLSSETNEGLIALETVAQDLSNQTSHEGVAHVLATALLENFEALQVSVHLLDRDQRELVRINHLGREEVVPPSHLKVGEALTGHVAETLLQYEDVTQVDLEPETEICIPVNGIAMACPLVAGGRILGVLHVVLPDELGRFYLYNRVPMTLAHHAAMAFFAADLVAQVGE